MKLPPSNFFIISEFGILVIAVILVVAVIEVIGWLAGSSADLRSKGALSAGKLGMGYRLAWLLLPGGCCTECIGNISVREH